MKERSSVTRFMNGVLLLLTVLFVLVVVGFSFVQENREEQNANTDAAEGLVITNLDVGKGDAAVVSYDGMVGIIDTGTKDSFQVIKKFLKENNIRALDFLIITHYDKDHVGGADKLLDKYTVKTIYLPDYVSNKSGYERQMKQAEERDNVVMVDQEETITKGDCIIRIIPPQDPEALVSDQDNMDNNMSLLTMITLKEKKFLFTGDIEEDRIAQILSTGEDVSADWIKMPHHGGYEENSKDFLTAVSPQYSVISTGEERPADGRILMILSELGIRNYNTMNGSVRTVSDGTEIAVNYMEEKQGAVSSEEDSTAE